MHEQNKKFNKETEGIKQILEVKNTMTEEFNRELQKWSQLCRRKKINELADRIFEIIQRNKNKKNEK